MIQRIKLQVIGNSSLTNKTVAIEIMVQDGACKASGDEVEDEVDDCKRSSHPTTNTERHVLRGN